MKASPSPRRGGVRKNAGRPPLATGHQTMAVSIRLTDYQRAKLTELGGPAWIRDQIDLRIAQDSRSKR